ncbi:hypothetical protein VDG1235_2017 [Verrucomicrobiia bacterium DG1235]|nr:hypothetical protein VDG1235_2017 [Verrucomicrobiae bacterium DG1235]
MNILIVACQIIVALGLLNVWLLRRNQSTEYRGGSADNMEQEFATYGLPKRFMWTICCLKIAAAVALLAGIFLPSLVAPAASLVVALMLGALAMHIKVKDPIKKSLPAASVLLLSIIILASGQI